LTSGQTSRRSQSHLTLRWQSPPRVGDGDSLCDGCADYYCWHLGVDPQIQKGDGFFIACERVWDFVLSHFSMGMMMPNTELEPAAAAPSFGSRHKFTLAVFRVGAQLLNR
jgi:hypothetical protein